MDVEAIAKVCHEANRAYCAGIGDASQQPWEHSPEWQRTSAINGVRAHLSGELTPRGSHESWMAEKIASGWRYGDVKNAEAKEHPCMVDYDDLPALQRVKDSLFRTIVSVLTPTLGPR